MKKMLYLFAVLFCTLSLFAQEQQVRFYLNDGSTKSYKLDDIQNIKVITGQDNYLMKIFYQDSLTAYYANSTIDSLNFGLDTSLVRAS